MEKKKNQPDEKAGAERRKMLEELRKKGIEIEEDKDAVSGGFVEVPSWQGPFPEEEA